MIDKRKKTSAELFQEIKEKFPPETHAHFDELAQAVTDTLDNLQVKAHETGEAITAGLIHVGLSVLQYHKLITKPIGVNEEKQLDQLACAKDAVRFANDKAQTLLDILGLGEYEVDVEVEDED